MTADEEEIAQPFQSFDEEPELLNAGEVEGLTSGSGADDEVVRVLSKPAESRQMEDILVLQRATADIKFFERLGNVQRQETCRAMTYELVPAGADVYLQGAEGSTMYAIYMGAAKVFVAESGKAPKCVCVLEDGDSFGEVALQGSSVRTATVRAVMPTLLLRVEKETYDK